LIFLTGLMVIFPQYYQDLIAITLTTAIVLVFVKRLWLRLLLITLCSGLVILYQYFNGPNIFLFFLPTLVHVFLFTAIFIVHGALKRNSKPAYASAVLLFGVAISFFIFSKTPSNYLASELYEGNMRFFEEDIRELVKFFGLGSSWEYIMASARFVAFAYTYHYLNWFSKTETIGWHKIPRKTAVIIGTLYLLFVGLYLYDFTTGLKALVFLSLLHVILELPLNSITMRALLQTKRGHNP
jgi:hypothetical protein